jgi:hypothetical protein
MMAKFVEHFFLYLLTVLLHLKVSIQFICPFTDCIVYSFGVSFLNSLYILDINSLLDEYLAKIFYLSGGCLFTLVIVSLTIQRLFSVSI